MIHIRTSLTAMGLTSSLDLGNANAIRRAADINVEIDFGISLRAIQEQAVCRERAIAGSGNKTLRCSYRQPEPLGDFYVM